MHFVQEKFLIIFVDFTAKYAKTMTLRSIMNGVGVNKTDCPKQKKMTFSDPARSKTSHVFPFEQA